MEGENSIQEQVAMDVTKLLPDVLLRQVIELVGERSFRNVAGTCRRFKKLYQEVFDTCTTSAEETVSTLSGAKLFLRESSPDARFRLKMGDYHLYRRDYDFVRDTAAWNGRLQILQWVVVDEGFVLDDPQTCEFAARNGHLTLLQWAHANGCPLNSDICCEAALNGHLTLLQWASANGCPWDPRTCAEAARGGHLTLLQWARANGCPWDYETCAMAARNGHLALLQWARANGCPWDYETCRQATLHGQGAVLQWAQANGCPQQR